VNGTGFAQSSDTRKAIARAAAAALERMNGESPGLAVVFVGGRHDAQVAWEQLVAALGPIPIVGGAAVGCIGAGHLGYSGFEVVVSLFSARLGEFLTITCGDLRRGEFAAGEAMGRQIAALGRDEPTVLLFFDSMIDAGPPPELHPCSHLIDGLYAGLDGHAVRLSGAGTLADYYLTRSWLFDGRAMVRHAAVAVICPPTVEADTTIFHGCIPVSGYYTVTRIDGATLYELDGQPAASVIGQFVPVDMLDSPFDLMLHVTIGQNHGPPFSDFDERNFVNRLILDVDRDSGALRLFDADFSEGAVVQLMLRDPDKVLESVRTGSARVAATLLGRKPLAAFYFDCAGRAAGVCGMSVEEADIVQANLGPELSVCGFYSAVEIAPILGRSRPLDWTGVLTVLAERPG
jgi:hypothetical protein